MRFVLVTVHAGTPIAPAESRAWESQPTLGPGGRLYVSEAIWQPSQATRLAYLEPGSCDLRRTSEVDGFMDHLVGTPDRVVAIGAAVATYDPASDAWSEHAAIPGELDHQLATWKSVLGPDGRLYVPGFYPEQPALWALDIEAGTWQSVGPPDDVAVWDPMLATGVDGHLYALRCVEPPRAPPVVLDRRRRALGGPPALRAAAEALGRSWMSVVTTARSGGNRPQTHHDTHTPDRARR